MIVVGIDGGGTKTELIAVDSRGRFLGRHRGGPTNLHGLGVQETSREIESQVRSLVAAHGDPDVLVAACLSGIDTDAMQVDLTRELQTREPRWTWLVDNDATAAWWGAFGGRSRPGVVTIAGTGAVSYARSGARSARAGGWGALLGDEGSGYSVGRAAIIAVLRATDGLGPATALREAVLSELQLVECHQLIDHVHVEMSFADVAALAPVVVGVAQDGDPVAQAVVHRAADALVELADAAATRVVDDEAPVPVDAAFVGGLAHSPYVRRVLHARLAGSQVCRWVEPDATAAVGAVLLGASRLGLSLDWSAAPLTDLVPAASEDR
ncbi:MAG: N-acetylglucosamine kinaselike protein [Modestobacter sp.]|jgi:N-acetylglucosamine kinase-like BadF-type ATPase|nr:N-acetylglucosamine kinaselike protein [Modestobacter sp.]